MSVVDQKDAILREVGACPFAYPWPSALSLSSRFYVFVHLADDIAKAHFATECPEAAAVHGLRSDETIAEADWPPGFFALAYHRLEPDLAHSRWCNHIAVIDDLYWGPVEYHFTAESSGHHELAEMAREFYEQALLEMPGEASFIQTIVIP